MQQDSTERIVAALRTWIGGAVPGSRVPSNRTLVDQFGASPVTVQKAMRQLVALGLVEARPGVGTFVRGNRPPRPASYGWQTAALGTPVSRNTGLSATQRPIAADAIGLHSGYPARELLPERLVRQALARAARTDVATTRSPTAGNPDLQAWFAHELSSAAPAGTPQAVARDVVILSGSQSGLSSIFRALVGQGQPLLIESPTYWGAMLAAEQAGVTLIPIPTGAQGPDPDEIERAFLRTGARAMYVQPAFANPTGGVWPVEIGRAVLEAARRHGAFLIEDDWAHDFAIDATPHPLATLDDDGHVIYLRSLTKSVSPAIRVAAAIARGPARDRIVADRAAESMYVSGLLQAAALDVVSQPAWRAHVRTLREQLRVRRDALLSSLSAHTPSVHVDVTPLGGLNVWARLPDGVDPDRVASAAASDGLVIAAGGEWFPAEPSGPYVRLNYSGENPERFAEAAMILEKHVSARVAAG